MTSLSWLSEEKLTLFEGHSSEIDGRVSKAVSFLVKKFNLTDTGLIKSLESSMVVVQTLKKTSKEPLAADVGGHSYLMFNMTSIESILDFSIKLLVSHECIIKIIGLAELKGQIFYLQEKYSVSLKGFMAIRALDWKKVFLRLVSAVILLHSKGVVSAALDPDMLVYNKKRGVLIQSLDAYHLQNVNYLAPEFIFFKQVTQESNVWTLGCLLVFLITGVDPFQNLSRDATPLVLLNKETIYKLLENDKLAPVREILKSIFKLKQSKRLQIEALYARIQKC